MRNFLARINASWKKVKHLYSFWKENKFVNLQLCTQQKYFLKKVKVHFSRYTKAERIQHNTSRPTVWEMFLKISTKRIIIPDENLDAEHRMKTTGNGNYTGNYTRYFFLIFKCLLKIIDSKYLPGEQK